ncbi:MAG TPA: hypothetical protein VKG78_08390, partial [Opitutaceae bacterium]|nr:hypothetical protein [Opitutaceae bacterium]
GRSQSSQDVDTIGGDCPSQAAPRLKQIAAPAKTCMLAPAHTIKVPSQPSRRSNPIPPPDLLK